MKAIIFIAPIYFLLFNCNKSLLEPETETTGCKVFKKVIEINAPFTEYEASTIPSSVRYYDSDISADKIIDFKVYKTFYGEWLQRTVSINDGYFDCADSLINTNFYSKHLIIIMWNE